MTVRSRAPLPAAPPEPLSAGHGCSRAATAVADTVSPDSPATGTRVSIRTVALPPAVTLFAVIAFAILFGAMGALLAAPLAVVTLVLVQDLYVKPIEENAASVIGEQG